MKELDKLIFYNPYNLGDVHVSLGFVCTLVKNVPAGSYEYYHRAAKRRLLDGMPSILEKDLKTLDTRPLRQSRSRIIYRDEETNTAYINTWYGVSPTFTTIADCTLETLFASFLLAGQVLGIELPDLGPWALPPSFKAVERVFIPPENPWSAPRSPAAKCPAVLICNARPLSDQAEFIDFHEFAEDLVREFPNAIFAYTNPPDKGQRCEGVDYVDQLFGTELNLPECVAMSRRADLIIGQSTSPYTFMLNRENLMDRHKTFLCFCRSRRLAHWADKIAQCTTVWAPDEGESAKIHTSSIIHDVLRGATTV